MIDWLKQKHIYAAVKGAATQSAMYKPLPQKALGSVIGILGGVIAAILIIAVAVTVFIIYRYQQKHRTETDNDLIDLPPSHKPVPPSKKKQQEMKSHLTADDIQVVHLDKVKQEEEIQKLPLQTPYYDMVPTETSTYLDKSVIGRNLSEFSDLDDYASHQHTYKEDYLEQLHSSYNLSSYCPQDPDSRLTNTLHPHYPSPVSQAPYVYPKEQYV
ncbi:uncharacterized protein LOC122808510 [Protopterus annectens]|uniref:uncharacterized protein LOC122808510 n=1 Tax=Protopterus annectens TaxID=7888 RepID=UPI001CF94033|nr:uncharacterized protein LOC122808510 [Protopterus annectens]